MPGSIPRRQKIRRIMTLVSFFAFPITLNYFSPYLIVDSAFGGIVNGSLIVFVSLFIGSLFFGRLWCGWLCPAIAIQEPLLEVNNRRVRRKVDLVKWIIWVPWLSLIVFAAITAGGYDSVDLFYGTVDGISVAGDADRPVIAAVAIYLMVIALFFLLSLGLGRRGGCHAVCWMAPFMITGRSIRNTVAWPSLRLVSNPSACIECGKCTSRCPMGLDVQKMVASSSMENPECVLCGTCVDGCPQGVIRYSFSSGTRGSCAENRAEGRD